MMAIAGLGVVFGVGTLLILGARALDYYKEKKN